MKKQVHVFDSSVAVAVMATNLGRLWDYVYGGTGSEMNEWGVICKEDTHEKIGFGNVAGIFERSYK